TKPTGCAANISSPNRIAVTPEELTGYRGQLDRAVALHTQAGAQSTEPLTSEPLTLATSHTSSATSTYVECHLNLRLSDKRRVRASSQIPVDAAHVVAGLVVAHACELYARSNLARALVAVEPGGQGLDDRPL